MTNTLIYNGMYKFILTQRNCIPISTYITSPNRNFGEPATALNIVNAPPGTNISNFKKYKLPYFMFRMN